jgi:hypothetical protein
MKNIACFKATPKIVFKKQKKQKNIRLGWFVYESVGLGIVNDYALSKIVILQRGKKFVMKHPKKIIF